MRDRIERGDTDNSEETVVEFDLDTIVPVNTRVRVLYDDGILLLLCGLRNNTRSLQPAHSHNWAGKHALLF